MFQAAASTAFTASSTKLERSKHPQQRFKQHMRTPPFRMRGDRKKYQPADFGMLLLFDTADKASVDLIEEFFIWKFHALGAAGYNSRHSSSDPITF